VVALVLLFLTKPLEYLPNAVLSAVVFLIGVKLVAIGGMRTIYRLRRDEFWVALLTALVVVVLGVEQGIILAIELSLIVHARRHFLPHDAVVRFDPRDTSGWPRPRPGWSPSLAWSSTGSRSGSSTPTPSASPRTPWDW